MPPAIKNAGSRQKTTCSLAYHFARAKPSMTACANLSFSIGRKYRTRKSVTSVVSDEGKTITALNLAIALAKEQDHTVLLVDTDLRRPSIHKYFGIEPEFGLAHCLRDGLPIEKALVKTGIGKLVVLPAGEAVKDPLDMLSLTKIPMLIKMSMCLNSRYHHPFRGEKYPGVIE